MTDRSIEASGDRRWRGQVANLSGLSAEDAVARDYERRGLVPMAARWRGAGGEIDLIFRDAQELVFVEVKKARDTARAADSLRPAQIQRLCAAAEEFLSTQPAGALTPMRFDVALVSSIGTVEIIENAFGGP